MNGRSTVLDACVLVPSLLCDLLLRLAEEDLFEPRWTEEILEEVFRNQVRLGYPESYAAGWRSAVGRAFPSADVAGYETHVGECTNDPKDRHVLAAAIEASCPTIVTFNLGDFAERDLSQWSVIAIHPGRFLSSLHKESPENVHHALTEMAERRSLPLRELAVRMRKVVPKFIAEVALELGLSLD